jgi:hypothetical protein
MLAGDGLAASIDDGDTAAFIACEEVANDGSLTTNTLDATESSMSATQPRGKKASFSINDAVVSEPVAGTFGATFTVVRSGDTTTAASVYYRTADGTAIAPDDYEASGPTMLSFAPDETAKYVTILVKADDKAEPDEVFYVDLFNPENPNIKDAQGKGTIWDTNTNATAMFVSNIGVVSQTRGRQTDYGFVVDVRDEFGNAVSGATVAVKLSDPSVPEGDHDHIVRQWIGMTDASGRMTTSFVRDLEPGKTYNVEVIDVYLEGYAWSPKDSLYGLDSPDDDDDFPEHNFTAGDANTY